MATVKKTFPVTGMSCASCAANVEKTLNAQQGVKHATVNLANASALVEFDDGTASIGNIKRAVQSTGYDILIENDAAGSGKLEEISRQQYRSLRLKTILA